MKRLLAKLPTLAAFCFRHVKGLPFIYPDNDLGYVENFLSMVARMSEPKYEGNPVFVYHAPQPTGASGGEFDDQFTWITVGELMGKLVAAGRLP